MPDTKPGVFLNEKGLCNACRSQESKRKINWKEREAQLCELTSRIKQQNNGTYDCLVPVSGGKNSWYQAYTMAKKHKLKILGCTLGAHIPTKEGISNLNKMIESVDMDLIKITLKPSVYKSLRRKTFFRQGEPNWSEHLAMFSATTNIAQIYDIPLIVWGEDFSFEFGGIQTKISKADASDIDKNDLIKDKVVDDFLDDDIRKRDTFFYRYPDLNLEDGRALSSIYLGHFDFWDGKKQYEIVKKMGFTGREEGSLSGNYIDYDNIDEKLCEINIWLKYIKFGFWRSTDQTCYDIWNERLNREDAIEIVNQLRDQFPNEYFDDFLRFHDITENEFWEVVEEFRNRDIWKKDNSGEWKLKNILK